MSLVSASKLTMAGSLRIGSFTTSPLAGTLMISASPLLTASLSAVWFIVISYSASSMIASGWLVISVGSSVITCSQLVTASLVTSKAAVLWANAAADEILCRCSLGGVSGDIWSLCLSRHHLGAYSRCLSLLDQYEYLCFKVCDTCLPEIGVGIIFSAIDNHFYYYSLAMITSLCVYFIGHANDYDLNHYHNHNHA